MTYIVGSVGVEVSTQAVRPREPARPAPALTLASTMLATRQARPRSAAVGTAQQVAAYIAQLKAYKGRQTQLEKYLKVLGTKLHACKKSVATLEKQPGTPLVRARIAKLKVDCVRIEREIVSCIKAIKACAARANAAAESAIVKGASEAQVQQAAAAVTPASGNTVAVESSTAAVTPNGQIVPGSDATLVTTPTLEEAVPADTLPGEEVTPGDVVDSAIEDVEATSAGMPLWMKLAGAGAVGWFLFLRKK